MGMKFVSGNFLNATNNRLECINSKLKSVISRYSSLEEFLEKFFLILRVIRSEQDQKAALAAQKLPIAFYSVQNASTKSYMRYLTPYAYQYVCKQQQLMDKVKLDVSKDEEVTVTSSERILKPTLSMCSCTSWQSMRLPCRHILAFRKCQGEELFDEKLCDKRWSSSYCKRNQRIFTDSNICNPPSVDTTKLPQPKKRIMSQVW